MDGPDIGSVDAPAGFVNAMKMKLLEIFTAIVPATLAAAMSEDSEAVEAFAPAIGEALGVDPTLATVFGQTVLTSAATVVDTGLSTVQSCTGSLESTPTLTCEKAKPTVGNQDDAPAAGSIIIEATMPTAVDDNTPIAATGFAGKVVNWVAYGTV